MKFHPFFINSDEVKNKKQHHVPFITKLIPIAKLIPINREAGGKNSLELALGFRRFGRSVNGARSGRNVRRGAASAPAGEERETRNAVECGSDHGRKPRALAQWWGWWRMAKPSHCNTCAKGRSQRAHSGEQ